MTLICFASQKGSPGATATALAVAASLDVRDGRRKLLLEADSTGGTLAIRYQLPVEPGLLTLAAAARAGLTSADLWRHSRELPGGLPVIVCPDGPEQVNAAMAASGAQLGRFLSELRDVDVICDVGRLAPESPALAFVAEASALLMVARPTAEQLQPAARRMIMLRQHVTNIGWVLIGEKPYGPAEVEQTYDFPVVGVIADDPRSVASFESGVVTKRLRRHPFVRSATTLANTLSQWLSPITEAPAVTPAPTGATPPSSTSSLPSAPVAPSPSARPGDDQPPRPPDPPGATSPSPDPGATRPVETSRAAQPPSPSGAAPASPPPAGAPPASPPPAGPPVPNTAAAPPNSANPSDSANPPDNANPSDSANPSDGAAPPAAPAGLDLGPQVSLEPAPRARSASSAGSPDDDPADGPADANEPVVLQPAVFRQRNRRDLPRASSAPPNLSPPSLDGVPAPGRRPPAEDATGTERPAATVGDADGAATPRSAPPDVEPNEDGPDSDRLVG